MASSPGQLQGQTKGGVQDGTVAKGMTENEREERREGGANKGGWEHLVGGVAGGGLSCALFYPLQIAQTRTQVNGRPGSNNAVYATRLRDILHETGGPRVQSLYQGLHSAMIATTVAWGSYFWLYSHSKNLWQQYIDNANPLPATAHLLCGFEAGALTCFVANPFFVINTRMQLQSYSPHGPRRYTGVFDAIKTISAQEGIAGFYRGLVPSLFGVVQGALQFMFFEQIKLLLLQRRLPSFLTSSSPFSQRSDPTPSVYVHSPHHNPFQNDAISIVSRVPINETTPDPEHVRRVVAENESTSLVDRESVTSSLLVLRDEKSLSIAESLVAGSLSKTFALVLTYPYQVVKSRLQLRPTHEGTPEFNGVRDTIRKTWHAEGLRGFFRGCFYGVLRSAPASAVTFATYEFVVSIA